MTGKTPPADAVTMEIWQVASRWRQLIRAELRPLELTLAQYAVLRSLVNLREETGDAVSQRALSVDAGLDKMTVSQAAQALTARGLIDRGPDGSDSRRWRVVATAQGLQLLTQANKRAQAVGKELLSPLDSQECSKLIKTLGKLRGTSP